jgi:hypothetical protein
MLTVVKAAIRVAPEYFGSEETGVKKEIASTYIGKVCYFVLKKKIKKKA